MNRFLVRVELNGSPSAGVYGQLHERLHAKHVYRHILGDDGVWYDLPNATYQVIADTDAIAVRDFVLQEAESIWRSVDVIVADYLAAAWKLSPTNWPRLS